MDGTALGLHGVRKRYPRFALDGIDLDLPAGRSLGLIGPNGAGKSTLLRIVMGLVRADAGRVEVLGLPMPAQEARIKARVGFVSEDMALYGSATLGWHMRLVRSLYPGWDEGLAASLLERFDLRPDQKARGMSRGQQVKAMFVLTLAHRPELLLLDEPLAGLDPLARHEVLELLTAARHDGRSVVFSSHRGDDVSALADDVAFLDAGRIGALGPVSDIVGAGRSLEQAFLDHVGIEAGGMVA